MELPTLADRAWYALHCLRRDDAGKPPALKDLEVRVGLSYGTLSHVMCGRRSQHRPGTFPLMARALGVSEAWLRGEGGARGPMLTGMIAPRPGARTFRRHGDVPGWQESVTLALLEPRQLVPPAAFLAGADMPVYRPIDRITPEIAIFVAGYCYGTSIPEVQEKYSTRAAQEMGPPSGMNGRASHLRRPAVK